MSHGVVTRDEFPHGLRCIDCNRIIENGEPYTDRPAGAVDEVMAGIPRYEGFETTEGPMDTRDLPVMEIICVTCSGE